MTNVVDKLRLAILPLSELGPLFLFLVHRQTVAYRGGGVQIPTRNSEDMVQYSIA